MSSKHNVLNRRGKKREKKVALQRRRKHRERLTCPVHHVDLVLWQTQFGPRWNCPQSGCTVACWSGATSAPADDATRYLRHQCHEVFDALWKNGGWSRETAYEKLAEFMRLSRHDCHIGMMTAAQCEKLLAWATDQKLRRSHHFNAAVTNPENSAPRNGAFILN